MYLTRDRIFFASMAYISIASVFVLTFLIFFALWDTFLPDDPLSPAHIGFNCYTKHRKMINVFIFLDARDTFTSGCTQLLQPLMFSLHFLPVIFVLFFLFLDRGGGSVGQSVRPEGGRIGFSNSISNRIKS